MDAFGVQYLQFNSLNRFTTSTSLLNGGFVITTSALVGEGGDPLLVGFGDDEIVTRFEIRDVPFFGGGDGGDSVESAWCERADDGRREEKKNAIRQKKVHTTVVGIYFIITSLFWWEILVFRRSAGHQGSG